VCVCVCVCVRVCVCVCAHVCALMIIYIIIVVIMYHSRIEKTLEILYKTAHTYLQYFNVLLYRGERQRK